MTEQDLADQPAQASADDLMRFAVRKAITDEIARQAPNNINTAGGIKIYPAEGHVELDTHAIAEAALASLRRSSPASGEMREAVDPEALIAKTYAQVISEGMAIYRNEGNDISDRRAIRAFIDRFELRARTPSGETREEAGNGRS